MNTPVQMLENAMKPIIDEMFQNGPEEACRVWDNYNHPLQQAVAILFRAQCDVKCDDPRFLKEVAMLIEQHRRMEEEGRPPVPADGPLSPAPPTETSTG
jgi:hypothetical protein